MYGEWLMKQEDVRQTYCSTLTKVANTAIAHSFSNYMAVMY